MASRAAHGAGSSCCSRWLTTQARDLKLHKDLLVAVTSKLRLLEASIFLETLRAASLAQYGGRLPHHDQTSRLVLQRALSFGNLSALLCTSIFL